VPLALAFKPFLTQVKTPADARVFTWGE